MKEIFLLCFGIGIMDECDLLCRYTIRHQLCLDVIVHIEGSVFLRSGKVTEYKLSQLICISILIDTENIANTGVELTVWVIRQHT